MICNLRCKPVHFLAIYLTRVAVSPWSLWARSSFSAGVGHCSPSASAGTKESFSSCEYYPECNCPGFPGAEAHWKSWWTECQRRPQSGIASCCSCSVAVWPCPAAQPKRKGVKTEIHIMWSLWRTCICVSHTYFPVRGCLVLFLEKACSALLWRPMLCINPLQTVPLPFRTLSDLIYGLSEMSHAQRLPTRVLNRHLLPPRITRIPPMG